MKDIVRNSFLLTLTEFALIILAIFRNKVVAITIGPEGLGIYGLLNSYFAILMVASATWMCSIVVKYIAEYKYCDDFDSVNNVINITLIVSFVISVILIFFSLLFRDYIIGVFFNGKIGRAHV